MEQPALHAWRFGRFRIDPDGRRVTDETGAGLPLAGRAFDVLEYLIRHRDRVVSKEELLAAVWPGVVVEENNLNQAVSTIRRVLRDSRNKPEFLATVPGRGYRFVARLQDPAQHAPAELSAPRSVQHRRLYLYAVVGLLGLLVAGQAIVGMRREAVPMTPPSSEATAQQPLDRPAIAVLPFRSSADGASDELLTQSVTDLLRNRLAAFRDVIVIAGASTAGRVDAPLDMSDMAQRLRVRFVLQGSVARTVDQLRVDAQLVDTSSGAALWSATVDRSATQAAAIVDEIAERVGGTLHIAVEPAAGAAARVPINLDAYALYIQGQQLMASETVTDVEKAVALFRRSTILDPNFARGYLALGQAEVLAARLGRITRPAPLDDGGQHPFAEAQKALQRSLELSPTLGEAWIARAALSNDPVEAEEWYRRGLTLAPNYGAGYMRFSEFLFRQYRKGEAIEMIDRARQIDPQTPTLHLWKAFLLMVSRSDVAGHDRLVREALAINPQLHPALIQLALSRYEYSGEFADAIRIIERSLQLDPRSETGKYLAARMYLDVDDPDAALSVLRGSRQPTEAMVEVAQYQRDRARAAALTRSRSAEPWLGGPLAPLAEAVRDQANVTRDYASTLALLDSHHVRSVAGGAGMRLWSRGHALVFAHTLILADETQRGRDLVNSVLVQIDSESVGRTADWFSRERAAAFAILGEDERALEQLALSVQTGKFYRWWYLAELDPVYQRLRADPRFQALAEQAKEHRRTQRALVDEMRSKGEVPKRAS